MTKIRPSIWYAFVVACALGAAVAEDDRDIFIHGSQLQGSAVKYEWSIKQSRLAALPQWDPAKAEAPVSPHQAVKAALEFARGRFGPSVKLSVRDIMLFTRGLERNPIAPEIWVYAISVECDPEPAEDYKASLGVDVLMDGKVVVPVEKPEKTVE
jgi:hypothetical protein